MIRGWTGKWIASFESLYFNPKSSRYSRHLKLLFGCFGIDGGPFLPAKQKAGDKSTDNL